MRRLLVGGLVVVTSCYTFAPIEPAAVQPGMAIRARVSAAAGDRIAPLLQASDRRLITGTLVERGDAGMIVEVPSIVPADVGTSIQTLHQRISIARSELIELETRKLDAVRTGAVVGAVALVVGSAAIKAFKDGAGSEGIPGGGTTDIRIMLFRVVR